MITIIYSNAGVAVPDCEAEQTAFNAWKDGRDLKVSTDNVITAIRCLISEGKIPPQDIVFVYADKYGDIYLHPDKDGRLENWPKGFCDYMDDWLVRMLDVINKE